MDSTLDLTTTADGAARTIVARGQLDMDSSPALHKAIQESLRKSDVLRVDLAGIAYVDSSGIATLIQGVKAALKRSARFVLVDPSPQVMAVIELSQLDDFFAFERSGESA